MLLPVSLHSTNPDSLAASESIAQMVEAIAQSKADSAAIYQQRAAGYFRKADNLARWQDVWLAAGKCWRDRRNAPLEALAAYRNAMAGWRQPTSEAEWIARCKAYLGEGYILAHFLNDQQGAQASYEAAYQFFDQKTSKSDASVAKFLFVLLANTYLRNHETERATLLCQSSIEFGKENNLPDLVGRSYNVVGLALKNAGRYPESIRYFQEGIAHGQLPSELRLLLQINLGLAHYESGNQAEALKVTVAAERTLAQLALEDPETAEANRPFLLENYGLVYAAQKKSSPSRHCFEEAMRLQVEANGGSIFSADISSTALRYAESLLDLKKDPAAALAQYQQALGCLMKNAPDGQPDWLPSPDDLYNHYNILEALSGKAACYQALHEGKPAPALLEKALACHELMAKTEDLLREGYQFESATVSFLEESEKRAGEAIGLAHRLWMLTGDQAYLEKGFWFNERTKSLRVLEEMRRSRLALQGHLPKADLDELRGFRNSLVYHEQALADEKADGNALKVKALEEKIFKIKQEKGLFEKSLQARYPAWGAQAEAHKIVAVETALAALPNGTAMLSYFAGEGALYVFVLSNPGGTKRFEKMETPAHWLQTVADYHTAFTKTGQRQPAPERRAGLNANAGKLYDLLLAKPLKELGDGVQRLIIVPDNMLGYVPFETLHPGAGTPQGFSQVPFLLKKYSISYAYSASLMREQRLLPLGGRAPKLLAAFAPRYEGGAIAKADTAGQLLAMLVRDGEYDLAGAQEEASILAKLTKGRVFAGAEANEMVFRENAGRYRILHLAMHSLTDDENPQFSHLLFSRNPAGTLHDGKLTALELNNLQLRAELAVLSACNTGYGKLNRGEGIMSLARAFTFAGTPAVVMSLWKVEDGATRDIMVAFYGHLSDGLPKDEALRQAKLGYLAAHAGDDLLSDPYFWAGFVAVGDMRPLDMKSGGAWVWWLLGSAALLAAIWWRNRRAVS